MNNEGLTPLLLLYDELKTASDMEKPGHKSIKESPLYPAACTKWDSISPAKSTPAVNLPVPPLPTRRRLEAPQAATPGPSNAHSSDLLPLYGQTPELHLSPELPMCVSDLLVAGRSYYGLPAKYLGVERTKRKKKKELHTLKRRACHALSESQNCKRAPRLKSTTT